MNRTSIRNYIEKQIMMIIDKENCYSDLDDFINSKTVMIEKNMTERKGELSNIIESGNVDIRWEIIEEIEGDTNMIFSLDKLNLDKDEISDFKYSYARLLIELFRESGMIIIPI